MALTGLGWAELPEIGTDDCLAFKALNAERDAAWWGHGNLGNGV